MPRVLSSFVEMLPDGVIVRESLPFKGGVEAPCVVVCALSIVVSVARAGGGNCAKSARIIKTFLVL